MSDGDIDVAELADYCRTQARFLWGRVETLEAETEDLLDALADDIATLKDSVAEQDRPTEESTVSPETPTDGTDQSIADLEAREQDIAEAQAVAEAKQARRDAFADLATAYADLAADLDGSDRSQQDALARVVEFERDHDAPAYFEDQQTLLEAVAESAASDDE